MSIKKALASWDRKSADDISEIYGRHGQAPSFTDDIIGFMSDSDLQTGATWLLKRHFESGAEVKPEEADQIYGYLPQFTEWEAKLHILQCMPYMKIDQGNRDTVELFLRQCLTDSNKFVRAWAYNGFFELAIQFPAYRDETKRFFDMAMRDEAPSVKARIRNIMKRGF